MQIHRFVFHKGVSLLVIGVHGAELLVWLNVSPLFLIHYIHTYIHSYNIIIQHSKVNGDEMLRSTTPNLNIWDLSNEVGTCKPEVRRSQCFDRSDHRGCYNSQTNKRPPPCLPNVSETLYLGLILHAESFCLKDP